MRLIVLVQIDTVPAGRESVYDLALVPIQTALCMRCKTHKDTSRTVPIEVPAGRPDITRPSKLLRDSTQILESVLIGRLAIGVTGDHP